MVLDASWIAPIAFAAAGTLVVFALTYRTRLLSAPTSNQPQATGKSFQLPCHSCRKDLVIHANQLIKLSGAEVALSVRAIPKLVGRPLAEYVCPYCEASHCFALDTRPPECVGVNLYSPHTKTNTCQQCNKPLKNPPWPTGYFDGRLNEAPSLDPDYGMICSKCNAITCVACVKDATRNRTKDGAFVCPRCMRPPVTRMFHAS